MSNVDCGHTTAKPDLTSDLCKVTILIFSETRPLLDSGANVRRTKSPAGPHLWRRHVITGVRSATDEAARSVVILSLHTQSKLAPHRHRFPFIAQRLNFIYKTFIEIKRFRLHH